MIALDHQRLGLVKALQVESPEELASLPSSTARSDMESLFGQRFVSSVCLDNEERSTMRDRERRSGTAVPETTWSWTSQTGLRTSVYESLKKGSKGCPKNHVFFPITFDGFVEEAIL